MASYVYVRLQSGGRATGRSDPAPNPFMSRVYATGQALGRAWGALTASLPNRFSVNVRHATFNQNGTKKAETVIDLQAERVD